MFGKGKFPDGSRLLDPKQNRLWLVYDGACHHVTCNDVYSRLFKPQVYIKNIDQVEDVKEGERLLFGTRLVRTHSTAAAYLVAVHPGKVRLHPVLDFNRYGLDTSLCQQVSLDLLKNISKGRALS